MKRFITGDTFARVELKESWESALRYMFDRSNFVFERFKSDQVLSTALDNSPLAEVALEVHLYDGTTGEELRSIPAAEFQETFGSGVQLGLF